MIPTRYSYSMTDVLIVGPLNAADGQSSTCSPTDNSHTPSSKVFSSQSEIPHTLTTTYRITTGEHETCSYSIPTQNPFDPLLNTEQEKAATAEMKQRELTATLRLTQLNDVTDKKTPNSQKTILSPKEILGNISIPQRASLLLTGDSVIRHINTRWFTIPILNRCTQCGVPGVTTRDLCAWVHSLHSCAVLKQSLFISGSMTCPAGQILQNNWYELIALLKKSFQTHHCLSAQSSQLRGDIA